MITRTSGAQDILKCNCFHEAASTAEAAPCLPGAGPGEGAGAFMQCGPAAVKHLGCFSPQPPQSAALHRAASEALGASPPWLPVQVH